MSPPGEPPWSFAIFRTLRVREDKSVLAPKIMNDIKNFLIAYFSTTSSVFAAIEAPTVITIVSAVILPIMFFAIGKTIDVLLQIYLNRRREKK
jgi:HD superfamily phosphohydrolase